jgi:hypothetical protein
MAREIQLIQNNADTIYFWLYNSQATQIFNTSTLAFETFNSSNYISYAFPATNQGGGLFVANFPTSVTTAGLYPVAAYSQSGASPVEGDTLAGTGVIDWNGSQEILPISNTLCDASLVQSLVPQTLNYTTLLTNIMIPAASASVQKYCNRKFVIQTFNELYDINTYTRSLVLKQIPIQSITSVTILLRTGNPVVIPGTAFSYGPSGEIILFDMEPYSHAFTESIQNVQVIYSAGFVTIPPDVQYATAQVVAKMWYKSFGQLGQGMDTTMSQERLGDYQYWHSMDWKTLLTDDIKETLNPYRIIPI